jgi:epoxyqueuosine reductase QueG
MNKTDELARRVSDSAAAMGATVFGVADLTLPNVHDFMADQAGSDEVRRYPRSLSIGIALASGIVDQLTRVRTLNDGVVAREYQFHIYEVVNRQLNAIGLRLANILEKEGHSALPVAASNTTNPDRYMGYVSNKLSAHLAGLGWIGKSCLVITPELGPRLRWATVLTDAQLPAGTPVQQRCGDCMICVDACPVKAFTGRNFVWGELREARMIPERCQNYTRAREKVLGAHICGMCVQVCPHGQLKPTR